MTHVSAFAEKRIALVVGNSDYVNVPKLENPKNDAKLMADTLRGLGFSLVGDRAQLNLDKPSFDLAVQKFGDQLQGADVGLFYYAGHGVQIRGANYLIPVGANPTKEADVDFQMLDTNFVMRQMESSGAKLNLVILDACRNNPLGGRGLRSTDAGLAQMRAPEGTLISFATQPGNVAQDGADGNSPYTKALAATMKKPGLDIFRALNEVGLEVAKSTGSSQQPWVSASPIRGDFYFTPPTAGSDSDLQAQLRKLEEQLKKQDEPKVAFGIPSPAGVLPKPSSGCSGVAVVSLNSRAAQPLSAGEECSLKAKDVFKECDGCPEMVVVPVGIFTMGSPSNEAGRDDNEGPQRQVTIGKAFAAGKFEVTLDQFAAFIKDAGYTPKIECNVYLGSSRDRKTFNWDVTNSWRDGNKQTGSHPVTCIGWLDAKAYVEWLSRKTKMNYRLLTESEWEYAARAGTTSSYSFGDDKSNLCTYANIADQTYKRSSVGKNEDIEQCSDGYAFAAPVGKYLANAFGLYDMHGNVREWTEDCWNENYDGAPTDGTAWNSGTCSNRVQRGGNWNYDGGSSRSAARTYGLIQGSGYNFIGFRVARTLKQ
ncbi:MAG: SUMF1/EgtB/PvdO family nonheme iron enzyme [Afipia sp.]|nr:SUMF1/EgtB/PvdO family nonheme iron enzyme [Afipia sp.]